MEFFKKYIVLMRSRIEASYGNALTFVNIVISLYVEALIVDNFICL